MQKTTLKNLILRLNSLWPCALIRMFLAFSVLSGASHAANITVTSTADPGIGGCTASTSGDGCTLREAVTAANSSGSANTLTFDAAVFSSPQVIYLNSALPVLNSNLTLTGPSSGVTIRRDTGGDYGIFIVARGQTVILSNLTISNGQAPSGGGGINNRGNLTLRLCNISGNSAFNVGGGIYNESGTLTVENTLISNNMSGYGGGIFGFGTTTVKSSTIKSNEANDGDGGGIEIYSGTARITNSVIYNNHAQNAGSGIHNFGTLTVEESIIDSNVGSKNFGISGNGGGGGIANEGTLLVKRSTICSNSHDNIAGGIFNHSNGILTVEASTINDNSSAFGGGIGNEGTLLVENSTISGNMTTPGFGGTGGGINNGISGTLTVNNSTVIGNHCSNGGGGIANYPASQGFGNTVTLRNSLVALNTSTSGGPDVDETLESISSFNLIGNGTGLTGIGNGGNGNQIGTGAAPLNPKLGTLADNGGLTKTYALLSGSPAIDKGAPDFDGNGKNDQRSTGFPRVQGGRLDIGAYESLSLLPTLSINNVTKAEGNSGTSNATFTVTLSAVSSKTVTVAYATANGSAAQPADYTSTSGTLIFTSGQTSRTLSVPVVGDVLDENNETFTVTLSAATNATIATAVGTGTITDDDATPTLVVSDPFSQKEGSATTPGSATFTVTLSAASGRAVTVNYNTTNGVTNGALAGSDYLAKSGTLTFAPGETSKFVKITFVGDAVAELNEPFFFDIKTPVGATIADSRGSTYIKNDDGPGMSIANALTIDEGPAQGAPAGTKAQTFTVTLSAASPNTVTVNYTTANGTAGPADYTVQSGVLTFAPGETSKVITVLVKGDTTVEPTETYKVNLVSPAYAILTDSQGSAYIRNDDAAPLLFEETAPSQ